MRGRGRVTADVGKGGAERGQRQGTRRFLVIHTHAELSEFRGKDAALDRFDTGVVVECRANMPLYVAACTPTSSTGIYAAW